METIQKHTYVCLYLACVYLMYSYPHDKKWKRTKSFLNQDIPHPLVFIQTQMYAYTNTFYLDANYMKRHWKYQKS